MVVKKLKLNYLILYLFVVSSCYQRSLTQQKLTTGTNGGDCKKKKVLDRIDKTLTLITKKDLFTIFTSNYVTRMK